MCVRSRFSGSQIWGMCQVLSLTIITSSLTCMNLDPWRWYVTLTLRWMTPVAVDLQIAIAECAHLVGHVKHEMMHIMGFYHEHSRYGCSYRQINFAYCALIMALASCNSCSLTSLLLSLSFRRKMEGLTEKVSYTVVAVKEYNQYWNYQCTSKIQKKII